LGREVNDDSTHDASAAQEIRERVLDCAHEHRHFHERLHHVTCFRKEKEKVFIRNSRAGTARALETNHVPSRRSKHRANLSQSSPPRAKNRAPRSPARASDYVTC